MPPVFPPPVAACLLLRMAAAEVNDDEELRKMLADAEAAEKLAAARDVWADLQNAMADVMGVAVYGEAWSTLRAAGFTPDETRQLVTQKIRCEECS